MGVALYVALEEPIPGIDASAVDGKFLARAQPRLDRIATERGMTPLEAMVSVDPAEMADLLEGEGGLPDGVEVPAEQWFDPADGLRTVQALREHLRRDPSVIPDPERVGSDLQAAEKVLLAARDRGVRFHLAYDI